MMAPTGSAPVYKIDKREIVAVEHPMIIKNIDNGLKTFGRGAPLSHVSRSWICKITDKNCLWMKFHTNTIIDTR
jgi:hypothetical protein